MENTKLPTQAQSKSLTAWSEPCLDGPIKELLDRSTSYGNAAIVGPITAAKLEAFVKSEKPPLPAPEQIDSMITRLAIALPKKQRSDLEADELVEIYNRGLRDIPLLDLYFAYDYLIKTEKWFPEVSVIRKAAAMSATPRSLRRHQAEILLLKHRREWTPPYVPDVEPGEVSALLERHGIALDEAKK